MHENLLQQLEKSADGDLEESEVKNRDIWVRVQF